VSFSPSRLSPDPSRLNAFGGLKNLTGKDKLWGAARGLLVAAIAGWAAWPSLFHASLPTSASASTSAGLLSLGELAARILRSVGAIALGFAAVDVIVGRQTWLGRLRMSRDEVMREHKEGEGDPEIKHRREELHHELMAGEAVSAVRDATVLVVNPTHLACALRYDGSGDDDVAPTLTGKGAGAIAARMIEAARIYGVPIVRDVPVARALYDLEVGTEIPELLYEAVAEVLRSAWEESAGAEANAEP
jgi:type III secretion protein U